MKEATASPKDAALKLALDALEIYGAQAPAVRQTITAIKEALAQDELCSSQEPVAFISPGGHIHYDPYLDSVPLYTTPPKRPWGKPWVSLTDEGIQTIHDMYYRRMGPQEFAKAIEAKLKELNT